MQQPGPVAQVRPFFTKPNVQSNALASAYLETNSKESESSTKVACTFFGPMQLQAGSAGDTQADSCHVKVQIEFADEHKSAFLSQMPLVSEILDA